jgi:hypothetical protein
MRTWGTGSFPNAVVPFENAGRSLLVTILGYRNGQRWSIKRMRMFRHFPKSRDIPGIIFVLSLVVVFLHLNLKYPNRKVPTGFGPEWECSSPGRGGSSFCVKKPAIDPANQTETTN